MITALVLLYALVAVTMFAALTSKIKAVWDFDRGMAALVFVAAFVGSLLWPLTALWFAGSWLYRKVK